MSESPAQPDAWRPPSPAGGPTPAWQRPGQAVPGPQDVPGPQPLGGPAGAGAPPGAPPLAGPPGGPSAWGPPQYPGPAWQPPPRPGVVPLRPLGLGELLDGSVRTMRQNPPVMFGLSAVVMAVAVVASTLLLLLGLRSLTTGLDSLEAGASREQVTSVVTSGLVTVAVPQLLQYLAGIVLTGILILAVGDAVLGRRPGVGEVVARARPRLLRLLGLSLLTGLLPPLAFLACLAPGVGLLFASGLAGGLVLFVGVLVGVSLAVWLWVHLAFAAPALLLEELGVRDAMARSWRLGKGSWWRVLGILVLTAIIASVAAALLNFPFSLVGGLAGAASSGAGGASLTLSQAIASGIGGIGTIVSTTVAMPFSAAVTALLYIDLRIRREGLDVALARAAAAPSDQAP